MDYHPRGRGRGRGSSSRGSSRGGGGSRGGRGGGGRGGSAFAANNQSSYDADSFFAGTPQAAAASQASGYFPLSFKDTSNLVLPSAHAARGGHSGQQQHGHQAASASSSSSSSSRAPRSSSPVFEEDGFDSNLLGDDRDRAHLASLSDAQRSAILTQRAETRKNLLLRRAHEALTQQHPQQHQQAPLSSGKSFAARSNNNRHPSQQRPRAIEFKDDLEADLAAGSGAGSTEEEEFTDDEDYEDDSIYNDEDTIFDMQEQAMMDGRVQKEQKLAALAKAAAAAAHAESQPSYKAKQKAAAKEKEKARNAIQPPPQPQQPHHHAVAPSAAAAVPFTPERPKVHHEDGLTHSERRAKKREEKLAAASGQKPHAHQQSHPQAHQDQSATPARAHAHGHHFTAHPQHAQPHLSSHNNQSRVPSGSPPRSAARPPAHGGSHQSSAQHRAPAYFPDHLSQGVLQAGLRNGVYVSGLLRIIGTNAFVSVTGLKSDVFIEGRKSRNRAFDGDQVVVQISGELATKGPRSMERSVLGSASSSSAAAASSASKPSKQSHQASLAASLANLVADSESNEDAKMAAEAAAKSKQAHATSSESKEHHAADDQEERVTPSVSPAGQALLTRLSAIPDTQQHRGVVVGVLRPKHAVVHAPGLLKPFSDHMALFVPSDRKTPFALLAEANWPAEFAQLYRAYLAQKAERKEASLKARRQRKEHGQYPLSAENSSDVIVEHEVAMARAAAAAAAGASSSSEVEEVDAMTAASSDDAPVLDAHIYIASYLPWQTTERQPFCTISQTLGLSGTIASETQALLIAAGVDYDLDGAFPPEVLAEVAAYSKPGEPWAIPAEEIARRRDFRDQSQWRIVSIDPTTARDLDDAIHIRDLGDDVVEIGVHIADVAHYLKYNSALDKEARHRATTIYLVQRALPMLPPILCEQLCSLNPNVDRLAFSTLFYLSKSTGVLLDRKPWFGKSVIRTCARLNYETAQLLMEFDQSAIRAAGREVTEQDLQGELAVSMAPGHPYRPVDACSIQQLMDDQQLLHSVSMLRRQQRFKAGSLTLTNVKLQFTLDANRNPTGFYSYVIRDSNRVVEECMLLANQVTARQCVQFCKNLSLLRRHPAPNEKGMEKVSAALAELGFVVDASSSGALQKSLSAFEGQFVGDTHGVNDVEIIPGTVPLRQVLEPLCTKPMQLAKYFCTGTPGLEDPATWFHFALAFPEYTHFTSPIRRYADVIVHRVLSYSLELEAWLAKQALVAPSAESASAMRKGLGRPHPPASLTPDEIVAIADHCNNRKAAAKKAQEASSKVYLCDYLLRNHALIPLSASAVIVDMQSTINGADPTFDVLLAEFGIEKKIHLSDLVKHGKVASADILPRDPPGAASANAQQGSGWQGGHPKPKAPKNNNKQRPSAAQRAEALMMTSGSEDELGYGSEAQPSMSSSPALSSALGALSLAGSTAPVPKSLKRLHITWMDGTSNVFKIFDSVDVELIVRRGPPLDIDGFVISPAVARERQAATLVAKRVAASMSPCPSEAATAGSSPSPDAGFCASPAASSPEPEAADE